MSYRRHKLINGNGTEVLVNVRDRYTFEARQAVAAVGEKIHFAHGDEYEHTVIYPGDGIEYVTVRLHGSAQYGSLVVYCNNDDIVLDSVLVHAGGPSDVPVLFPVGSAKVYVSSATGTTEIYKRILKFGKQ